MDRKWLTSLLRHTIYSQKQALIDELCPHTEAAAAAVVHNLPGGSARGSSGGKKNSKRSKTFSHPVIVSDKKSPSVMEGLFYCGSD